MSEFSDSYHLLGTTEDAIALVKRSGARAAVLPSSGRLTAIVPHPEDGKKLINANEGVLLFYLYGGDHGCWVRLYDGSRQVAELEQNWEAGAGSFSPKHWVRLGVLGEMDAQRLVRLTKSPTYPDEKNEYAVARLLGLSEAAWLSGSDFCLPDQLDGGRDGVIWVPERPEEEDPGMAMMRAMEPS